MFIFKAENSNPLLCIKPIIVAGIDELSDLILYGGGGTV